MPILNGSREISHTKLCASARPQSHRHIRRHISWKLAETRCSATTGSWSNRSQRVYVKCNRESLAVQAPVSITVAIAIASHVLKDRIQSIYLFNDEKKLLLKYCFRERTRFTSRWPIKRTDKRHFISSILFFFCFLFLMELTSCH